MRCNGSIDLLTSYLRRPLVMVVVVVVVCVHVVVVVFGTFGKQMSTKELVAVLGHEIGHWAYGHVLQNFLITQIYVLCSFMAFGSFVNSPDLYHAFGFAQMPTVIGLMLFFQTVWAPVDSVLNFVLTLHRWVGRPLSYLQRSCTVALLQRVHTRARSSPIPTLTPSCSSPSQRTSTHLHAPPRTST